MICGVGEHEKNQCARELYFIAANNP